MKQRGIGEYAIKLIFRKIKLKEILLPYHAAAVHARHFDETRGALQADRNVAEFGKHLEVTSRPGPQPKSSSANGGLPSIVCSNALMF